MDFINGQEREKEAIQSTKLVKSRFELRDGVIKQSITKLASYGHLQAAKILTRPAWAGFKTAEEGRAKICKFLWQKLKNKSNIEKHIMNNFITLLEQF